MTSRIELNRPVLMLVSDRTINEDRPLTDGIIEAASESITAVQLREKDLPASELLDVAVELKRSLPKHVRLIINDRMDVALAAEADGVQLGVGSLPVAAARRISTELLVGASVHSVDEAVQAERDGADYLIVGTMFATRTHPGKVPEGLALMQSIRAAVQLPLIGIGGITEQNAPSVMASGADGVAVISEILGAADPADAARRLRRALQ
jgi:thiamine-phosphate pyrophosphorylase